MLATAASLGLVIVLVVGMFQLMIPQLIESLIGIQDSFPLYVQNVYEWIQRILKNNPEIENMVLSSLENNLAVFQNWAEKSFTNIDMHRIGQIVTGVSSSVLGVLEFIKNWLIGLIVMVYLLNIKDTLAAQGKKDCYGCLNLRQANLVIEEIRFINQMFGGFIIGKLVDSLIYRYYLFHRCDDLKYAVPDAFERHYRCDECDTFFWTVHRCDTCSVPGILSQSAPVCVFPHLDSASAAV